MGVKYNIINNGTYKKNKEHLISIDLYPIFTVP